MVRCMTFDLIGSGRLLEIPISRYRSGKPYYSKCVKEYIRDVFGMTVDEFLIKEFGLKDRYCILCDMKISIIKFSGRQSHYTYNSETNTFQYILNVSKCCRDKSCESSKWNPVSLLYLVNVMNMEESDAKLYLRNKGIKSYNTLNATGYHDDASNNPFSKSYWIKRGVSIEDVDLYMSNKGIRSYNTLKASGYHDDDSNNPFSKSYWIKRGCSEEEAQNKVNSRNWACKEYTSGEIPEHLRGRTISVEYGVEVLGLSVDDARCRYVGICQKMKDRPISDGLFLINGNMASRSSQILFIKLYRYVRKKYAISRGDIYFALNDKGEYFIHTKGKVENKIFFYDFVIPKLKLCIEYNGHHVHPDPKLDAYERSAWRHAYTKLTYDEHLIKDKIKLSFMLDQDFTVLEVWDNDINCYENSIKFIEECVNEKK